MPTYGNRRWDRQTFGGRAMPAAPAFGGRTITPVISGAQRREPMPDVQTPMFAVRQEGQRLRSEFADAAASTGQAISPAISPRGFNVGIAAQGVADRRRDYAQLQNMRNAAFADQERLARREALNALANERGVGKDLAALEEQEYQRSRDARQEELAWLKAADASERGWAALDQREGRRTSDDTTVGTGGHGGAGASPEMDMKRFQQEELPIMARQLSLAGGKGLYNEVPRMNDYGQPMLGKDGNPIMDREITPEGEAFAAAGLQYRRQYPEMTPQQITVLAADDARLAVPGGDPIGTVFGGVSDEDRREINVMREAGMPLSQIMRGIETLSLMMPQQEQEEAPARQSKRKVNGEWVPYERPERKQGITAKPTVPGVLGQQQTYEKPGTPSMGFKPGSAEAMETLGFEGPAQQPSTPPSGKPGRYRDTLAREAQASTAKPPSLFAVLREQSGLQPAGAEKPAETPTAQAGPYPELDTSSASLRNKVGAAVGATGITAGRVIGAAIGATGKTAERALGLEQANEEEWIGRGIGSAISATGEKLGILIRGKLRYTAPDGTVWVKTERGTWVEEEEEER